MQYVSLVLWLALLHFFYALFFSCLCETAVTISGPQLRRLSNSFVISCRRRHFSCVACRSPILYFTYAPFELAVKLSLQCLDVTHTLASNLPPMVMRWYHKAEGCKFKQAGVTYIATPMFLNRARKCVQQTAFFKCTLGAPHEQKQRWQQGEIGGGFLHLSFSFLSGSVCLYRDLVAFVDLPAHARYPPSLWIQRGTAVLLWSDF